MLTYMSSTVLLLITTFVFVPLLCELSNSTVLVFGSPISPTVQTDLIKSFDVSQYREKHHSRRTDISCYHLQNVLFQPAQFAALFHSVLWNGFAADRSCCSYHSKDTLYCFASAQDWKAAQQKEMSFEKLCSHGNDQFSYTVVPWHVNEVRRACLTLRIPGAAPKPFSNHKLTGTGRTPKAAVLNFRSSSDTWTDEKIQALRRLLKLRSRSGFHRIYDREQSFFHKSKKFPLRSRL